MRPTDTCAPTRHTGEWWPHMRGGGSAGAHAPAARALQGEEPAARAAAAPPQASPAGPPRPRDPPPAAAAGCSPTRSAEPLRPHGRTRMMPRHARGPRSPTRTVLAAPAVQEPLQLHRSTPRLSVLGRAQVDTADTDFANPLALPLAHVEPAARWVTVHWTLARNQECPCAPTHARAHTPTQVHTTPPPLPPPASAHSHKQATPRPPPHRSRPAWTRPAPTAPHPPSPRSAAP
jgi:hypothetical protein